MSSTFSAWIAQRHRERREVVAKKIAQLEQLYSDFINESARLLVDAVQHSLENPGTLVPLYALLSRIRLTSSTAVIESGERVIATILKMYFEPNLTPATFNPPRTGTAITCRNSARRAGVSSKHWRSALTAHGAGCGVSPLRMEAHRAAWRKHSFARGLSPERHARKGPPQATLPSRRNTPYSVLRLALNEPRNAPEGRLWLPESTPRIAEDREGSRDAGY